MGRKDKNYSIDLRSQSYKRLTAMLSFGESKRAARFEGTDRGKIFAISTYKTYWKCIKWFIKYVEKFHPECTTLKKARKYVPAYLKTREERGLSAWTIQTEAKALGKLFGITPDDPDYYKPPERKRRDIKRSRFPVKNDAKFSENNNQEFVRFCRSIGPRRSEVIKMKGKDLVSREEIVRELEHTADSADLLHYAALRDSLMFDVDYFVHIIGKGGRERYSPVFGEYAKDAVRKMKETAPEEKVWKHVRFNADIHSYRSDYATTIYKYYARDIDSIPLDRFHKGLRFMYSSEVYYCKGDQKGTKLDRRAMRFCAVSLGHNRITVVASNYIRGL